MGSGEGWAEGMGEGVVLEMGTGDGEGVEAGVSAALSGCFAQPVRRRRHSAAVKNLFTKIPSFACFLYFNQGGGKMQGERGSILPENMLACHQRKADQPAAVQLAAVEVHGGDLTVFVGGVIVDALGGVTAGGV